MKIAHAPVILLTGLMFAVCTLPIAAGAKEGKAAVKAGKSRTFFFTYAATIRKLPAGKTARIWVPAATESAEQTATLEVKEAPARVRYDRDPVYGNPIMFIEAKANAQGRIPLFFTYRVVRREVRSRAAGKPAAGKIERFLQADEKVPVGGKPVQLLKGRQLPQNPEAAAKVLYDVVNAHMHYSKEGTGWGRGDAVWACDSRFGNCSDFHSLFISLARFRKIPAKFEIGFALPAQPGAGRIAGYHCWAWFLPPGKSWIPVDISEANRRPDRAGYCFGNLSADRIAFTTGRDIILSPRQKGPPLNFWIYPYVEVDGRELPAAQIDTEFSFQDVPK